MRPLRFSAAGKGYVGTGYDGEQRINDFWQYDPGTNTWAQKADFGGSARYGAVAFSINDIGYVGTGYDGNYLKDFWAYDPGLRYLDAKKQFWRIKDQGCRWLCYQRQRLHMHWH